MSLVGREGEMRDALKFLNEGRVLVIQGSAGVGKTAFVDSLCSHLGCRIGYCDPHIPYAPLNTVLSEYAKISRELRGGKVVLIHEYGNTELRKLYYEEGGRKRYLRRVSRNVEFETYPLVIDLLSEGYAVFIENFNYLYYGNEEWVRKLIEDARKEPGKLYFSGNITRIDGATLRSFDSVALLHTRGVDRNCSFSRKPVDGDIVIAKYGNYRIGKDLDPGRLYFEIADTIRRHRSSKIVIDFDDVMGYHGFEKSYIWLKDMCDLAENMVVVSRNIAQEELGDIALLANLPSEENLRHIEPSPVLDIAWSRYRLMDPEKEKLKVFNAVTDFINTHLSGETLVFENVEGCDPTTLDFLRYFVRNRDSRVNLIITVRSEGISKVKSLLEEISESGGKIVELGNLGYEDAKKLVSRDIPEDVFREIYRRSEGNPQFLLELASIYDRVWRYDKLLPIPENVREAVGERIGNLGDREYNLLRIASVFGDQVDRDALPLLYPFPEMMDSLSEFFSGCKFRSGIYREVAYEALPRDVRVELHRRLGEHYESLDKFKSCMHYYFSGDRRGARICLECAQTLREQYSLEGSLIYLEYAYSLAKTHGMRGKIWESICKSLGSTYLLLGRYKDALRVYGEARTLSVERADVYHRLGDYERALRILRNHLRYARGLDLGRTYGKIGVIYMARSKYDISLKYLRKYLWIAVEERSYRDISQAYLGLGNVYIMIGDFEKAKKYNEMAYKIAKDNGLLIEMERALNNLGHVYFERYEFEKVIPLLEEGLRIAEKMGNIEDLPLLKMNLGVVYGEMGNARREIEIYKEVVEMFRRIGDKERYALVLGNIGNSLIDQGKFSEARGYLEEALVLEVRMGNHNEIVWMKALLGEISLVEGNVERAKSLMLDALSIAERTGNEIHKPSVLRELGALLLISGDDGYKKFLIESSELYRKRGNTIRYVESIAYLALARHFEGLGDEAMAMIENLRSSVDSEILESNVVYNLAISALQGDMARTRKFLKDLREQSVYSYLILSIMLSQIFPEMREYILADVPKEYSKFVESFVGVGR